MILIRQKYGLFYQLGIKIIDIGTCNSVLYYFSIAQGKNHAGLDNKRPLKKEGTRMSNSE